MNTDHVSLRQMIHTRSYVQCHREKTLGNSTRIPDYWYSPLGAPVAGLLKTRKGELDSNWCCRIVHARQRGCLRVVLHLDILFCFLEGKKIMEVKTHEVKDGNKTS